MHSRLRGPCVAFHTPPHDLHMKQLFEPETLVVEAEAAWSQTRGLL